MLAWLCNLQYALNEQLGSTKFSRPWFSQNRHQNFGTGAPKKFFAFKTPIHDFRKQNNLFHLNSIRCNHRHRCYNYRRHTTTKTEVFALVRNSHRTLQLTVEKHSFLSKCRFTISHEHNNCFHPNFIYKLQTYALILHEHHSNFQTTANCLIFSKPMLPTDAACTKGKNKQKTESIILLHFSKLKFLSRPVNYVQSIMIN